jgi:hypothetical protein
MISPSESVRVYVVIMLARNITGAVGTSSGIRGIKLVNLNLKLG